MSATYKYVYFIKMTFGALCLVSWVWLLYYQVCIVETDVCDIISTTFCEMNRHTTPHSKLLYLYGTKDKRLFIRLEVWENEDVDENDI